jgi:hypothetical protein
MSKFATLDRFSKTLGVDRLHPGIAVPRKMCSPDYFGTGIKVGNWIQSSTNSLSRLLVIGRY